MPAAKKTATAKPVAPKTEKVKKPRGAKSTMYQVVGKDGVRGPFNSEASMLADMSIEVAAGAEVITYREAKRGKLSSKVKIA